MDNGQLPSPGNPTECHNVEIKKALRVQLHDSKDHGDSDKRLPMVLFTLQNRANAATGMALSELLLGRELKCPGDCSRLQDEPSDRPVEEREQAARDNQRWYQQWRYTNQGQDTATLEVGQPVYVKSQARPARGYRYPGWEPLWSGPFIITAAFGGQIYQVDRDG